MIPKSSRFTLPRRLRIGEVSKTGLRPYTSRGGVRAFSNNDAKRRDLAGGPPLDARAPFCTDVILPRYPTARNDRGGLHL